MAMSFKGAHFPKEIMLTGVPWYLAYPLSTRHVEALVLERRGHVDHSTINRALFRMQGEGLRNSIFGGASGRLHGACERAN